MISSETATNIGTLVAIAAYAFWSKWDARKRDAKLREIHTLVNSDMSRQLRTVMIMSQRLASQSNDAEDIRVAEQAKKDFDDHQAKQAIVDQQQANQ